MFFFVIGDDVCINGFTEPRNGVNTPPSRNIENLMAGLEGNEVPMVNSVS